jgi:RES domain-containing protein
MQSPILTRLNGNVTHRLIPSRYPPVGILDQVASAEDLEAVFELEAWTNDRVSHELGILYAIPKDEWVFGPNATVVMAAFCHPRPGGGRFNDSNRGAWYASFQLETAQREVAYHKTKELAEIGVFETRIQFREYASRFWAEFHDVRPLKPEFLPYHDPDSYQRSQQLAAMLLQQGSNGIIYRSVRKQGGECIACFRPALIKDVHQSAHFELAWEGAPAPKIRKLTGA